MKLASWIVTAAACLLMAGCGSSETATTERRPQAKAQKSAPLQVYEKDFTPSKFDVDIGQVESSSQRYTEKKSDTTRADSNQTMTLVPGFRVQVMLSGSIDEAVRAKNEVAQLFPTDMVYMIYDSPYYKVRLGDYQERSDATRALKVLLEKGYSQSWIVPDRVQNQPPHPAVPPPQDMK